MSDLTVVLTNYRRPGNLRQIVRAWKSQQHVPRLFLWNNGTRLPEKLEAEFDWVINSSINVRCGARWTMAAMAATTFVAVTDDDIAPIANDVASILIGVMKVRSKNGLAGPFGVALTPGKTYMQSSHIKYPPESHWADIIKGRLAVCRTNVLRSRLRVLPAVGEDDIAVSSMMADTRRYMHTVIGGMNGKFKELPGGQEIGKALCMRADHAERREAARRQFFPES